ncbi:hypothetical protein JT318_gp02 [Pseudomonas phage PspYZU01]|uniref:Uncharacterized protein n=1 Tax=Pseudomonas phage PspYZU01 TaxID=1983555 RepID=A0A2U7NMU5_9CAUD|nr:hypothetical protein JT318_gp02 [Pseudomonas phage PspYZU01]ASD51887.1 hypothetical protein PspYZU01_02 [Pseudomonas phage PspYZU01]
MTTTAKQLTITKVRASDVKAGPVDLMYKGAVYALTVNDSWGGDFRVTMPQDKTQHTGSLSHCLELVRCWAAAEVEDAELAAVQGAERLCIAIARVAHAIAAASPSAPGYHDKITGEGVTFTSRVGADYVMTEGPANTAAEFRASRHAHILQVAGALLRLEHETKFASNFSVTRIKARDLLPGMRVRACLRHPVRLVCSVAPGPDADSREVTLLTEDGTRWCTTMDAFRVMIFEGSVYQSEQAEASFLGQGAVTELEPATFSAVECPALEIDAELYKGRTMPAGAKTERRIVANLLAFLRFHGWPVVSVWDGEESEQVSSDKAALELIFNLDESRVYFGGGPKALHSVVLVCGNVDDIICDYTFTKDDPDGWASLMDSFDAYTYA